MMDLIIISPRCNRKSSNDYSENSCSKKLQPIQLSEFDFLTQKKSSADFIAVQDFTLHISYINYSRFSFMSIKIT